MGDVIDFPNKTRGKIDDFFSRVVPEILAARNPDPLHAILTITAPRSLFEGDLAGLLRAFGLADAAYWNFEFNDADRFREYTRRFKWKEGEQPPFRWVLGALDREGFLGDARYVKLIYRNTGHIATITGCPIGWSIDGLDGLHTTALFDARSMGDHRQLADYEMHQRGPGFPLLQGILSRMDERVGVYAHGHDGMYGLFTRDEILKMSSGRELEDRLVP